MTPNIPKLRALVAALRTPLPPTFEWDMGTVLENTDCGSVGCAYGLAVFMGLASNADLGGRQLGLSHPEYRALFFPEPELLMDQGYPGDYDFITPAIQADRIEKFIEGLK